MPSHELPAQRGHRSWRDNWLDQRAVHARVKISLPWLEDELRRSAYRVPIAAAIAAGDAQAAELAAREALTPPSDLASRLAGEAGRG
jgi:hypothetical protein